jgi:RimJ/RimL family protein N-acetyltransferase
MGRAAVGKRTPARPADPATIRPVVRLAVPADAPLLLDLQMRLDEQTPFMLVSPGERPHDCAALAQRLHGQDGQDGTGSFDLVAECGDEGSLVGWLGVEVAPYRRARHTGYVVLGVEAAACGQGIGSALLLAAEAEALRRDLRRLELTVMSDNTRALELYLRNGYEREGLRRQALWRDGTPVDEYYMARLLKDS